MDFNSFFYSAVPLYNEFEKYGFRKAGKLYCLKKDLKQDGFYVEIKIEDEKITAEVFEKSGDKNSPDLKYALLDVKNANGAFVSSILENVKNILNDFFEHCFEKEYIKEKYVEFLKKEFNVMPDFPWAGKKDNASKSSSFKSKLFSDYAVFRCKNNKWFSLIMNITYKNLGLKNALPDEKVFVVNLKADAEKIKEIVDSKSVFPAYHMNRKYWITVLLTKVTNFEKLCELTKRSYELVSKKK